MKTQERKITQMKSNFSLSTDQCPACSQALLPTGYLSSQFICSACPMAWNVLLIKWSCLQLCSLPTPYSLNIYPLPGQHEKVKSVTQCKHCSVTTKNQGLVNNILILTLKHRTALPARKKIDSIPAETRQGRKTILLLFVMVLLLFGMVWCYASAMTLKRLFKLEV